MTKINELVAKATEEVLKTDKNSKLPEEYRRRFAESCVDRHVETLKKCRNGTDPAALTSKQVQAMVGVGVSPETAQAIAEEIMAAA